MTTSAAQGITDGGNVERKNEHKLRIRRRAAPPASAPRPPAAAPPAAVPPDQRTSFRPTMTAPRVACVTLRLLRQKGKKYFVYPRMRRKRRVRRKKKRKGKMTKEKERRSTTHHKIARRTQERERCKLIDPRKLTRPTHQGRVPDDLGRDP